MLEVLGIDLQLAWRALRSAPGFTAADDHRARERDRQRDGNVRARSRRTAALRPLPGRVKLALLHEAVLAACDARDGVKDGVAPARSSVSINGAETINRSRALGSPLRDYTGRKQVQPQRRELPPPHLRTRRRTWTADESCLVGDSGTTGSGPMASGSKKSAELGAAFLCAALILRLSRVATAPPTSPTGWTFSGQTIVRRPLARRSARRTSSTACSRRFSPANRRPWRQGAHRMRPIDIL
jgi:hypothetical protein